MFIDGRVGRWAGGKVGRWAGGKVGKWESGQVGKWVGERFLTGSPAHRLTGSPAHLLTRSPAHPAHFHRFSAGNVFALEAFGANVWLYYHIVTNFDVGGDMGAFANDGEAGI